jgi:ligand-binding sensor domain-containing protein/signal transduction histidine kinase
MPKLRWTLVGAALLSGALAQGVAATLGSVRQGGVPYVTDVWETDDGLPGNSVTSIIQSRDGYLWFGTLNGLVRFDGLQFKVFDESNTPGLTSGRIVRLFEDRHGDVWVGTQNAGVLLIKDGQLTSTDIGQGGAEQHLASACQDSQGAVWLYTADGQLWRFWNERPSVFFFGVDQPSETRLVMAEETGPVWIGTDTRLAALAANAVPGILEPEVDFDAPVRKVDFLLASQGGGHWRLADGRITKVRTNRVERDLGPYPWPAGRLRVSTACEDRQGNLLVGTLGAGVFWFGPDGKVTRLSRGQGLSHDVILSLCVDREGSCWVGTDGGGLNRVKRQVFEVLDESRGLTASVVESVCEDDQGGLWIGSNGGGVTYWKGGAQRHFGPSQGLTNTHVWAVLVDRSRQVWVGTRGGGIFQFADGRFQRAPGSEALPAGVLALHQDRQGQIWMGTQGGLARWAGGAWRHFTTRDGLSADEVRALADDPEGNLWIGTVGGGLNRYRDGQFKAFHKPDGLPGESISSLHLDAEGVLWVGTFGSGLGRLERGQWTRYTTRDGLGSNTIGPIVDDELGHFWLGSTEGLLRVSKRELNDFARGLTRFITTRAYLKADGLATRECTIGAQPGACRSRDGRLWFPTVKGLVSVHPGQLNPNPQPPPVLIEAVLIDDVEQPGGTNVLRLAPPPTVIVPPGKERLEIRYTSLNLSAPDRGRFRYLLENYENAWVEAGNSRVAHYPKLPPGQYRFLVTACNEDGVWNEAGSAVELIVRPPFWRTRWFLGAASSGLLAAVVAVVHFLSTQRLQRQVARLKQQEELEQERSRIARDIHDQLGASLTQVALLGELLESDKDSPGEVEAHARQISQTARETARTLDEIVWAVNPSNDTLDGLVTYVCKHAQEYLSVAGLRCRVDVPAQLPGVTVPPDVRHNLFLAFKEAVTNIVRHAGASGAWVRLRLEPDVFILEIEDNGRGLAGLDRKAADSRNGLRNMRQRLESLGGRFDLGPGQEGGTLVRLTAPLARS